MADRAAFREAFDAKTARDSRRLLALLSPARDKRLVVYVLHKLERAGDPQVVPALFDYYERDDRPGVKNKLVKTLASLAGRDALPILRDALAADGQPCRYGAVEGLVRVSGEEAVEVLREGIHDPDRDLRANIAIGLGDMGLDAGVPVLAKMLNDHDRAVRTRAYRALVRIGSPQAIATLHKVSRRVQSNVWRWWIRRRANRLERSAHE